MIYLSLEYVKKGKERTNLHEIAYNAVYTN